jgi:(R,R)-butanediol dehydrogenase/meso-butanediol dehydrogenase/diacetyl reductase
MTSGVGMVQMPPGWILGHEFAGEVVALGAGVENRRVGERVAALAVYACGTCPACLEGQPQWCTGSARIGFSGAYAEYAVASARAVVPIPDSLSWDDGAIVEPLAVGLHGVHLAHLTPGAKVLVVGAGPIGLGAVYFARRMGATTVVVQATSRRRERLALEMGATAFIAPQEDPVGAAIQAVGGQPDVVFEAAGVPGALAQALDTVRPRGTVVELGWCAVDDMLIPALALMKELRLQFSMTYRIADFEHVIDVMARGGANKLRTIVTETVSFEALPNVFDALRGPSTHCKVLIDPRALA